MQIFKMLCKFLKLHFMQNLRNFFKFYFMQINTNFQLEINLNWTEDTKAIYKWIGFVTSHDKGRIIVNETLRPDNILCLFNVGPTSTAVPQQLDDSFQQ